MKERKRFSASANAQLLIAAGFLLIILLLAFLLMLPVSSADGTWTNPLDALFTAASAVCVTGLVVVDTATHWSLFGKLFLLAGIQIGGLGVMTVLVLVSHLRGRRIGLGERALLQESVSSLSIGGVVGLARNALLVTLAFELLGALLLSFRFVPLLGPVRGALYALFHAVSAFCNAGFDLMGTVSGPYSSLEAFALDPLVCLTVIALILAGGLGFFVWDDLIKSRLRLRACSVHTQLVLWLLPPLVFLPAALFFFLERNASMAGFSVPGRALVSLFSAVTPRTAGFDTVPSSSLSSGGSLLTMLLMLTGGNPGSTAGGVKTTTLLISLLLAASILRREEEIHLLGRRIEGSDVRRACAILLVYLSLSVFAVLLVCAAQPALPLGDVLFEVLSAINTVGMSTGVTRELNAFSRIVIILLMFAGRLGSLTFMLLFTRGESTTVRHPTAKVLIG